MVDVAAVLQNYTILIDQEMDRFLPSSTTYPQPLMESMRYSVFAGGKRLRPGLILVTAKACGLNEDVALTPACALEFIHTYSLIHDDLPAMDNDDYRRGKLTNHKVFGDAQAVLAGDALLTLAFEVLTLGELPDAIKVRLISELAFASGAFGMVGGQAADIMQEGRTVSKRDVEYIHRHKTGALLRASVRMGAICADASKELLQALTTYAEAIGLAFQIADDILDVIGDAESLGKETGADAALQKATWPALFGLEASQAKVDQLTKQALDSLPKASSSFDPSQLAEIAVWLSHRDH